MEKIRIKELIKFRMSSDKNKKKIADKLKSRKPKVKNDDTNESGGDYWITSNSCLYNVLKFDKIELIESKIQDLNRKYQENKNERSRTMFKRNIVILEAFKDFDFKDSKPKSKLKYLSIHKEIKTFNVKDIPIYVNPSLIFTYVDSGKNYIGAIWLIPMLHGFKNIDLILFCEILFKFLMENFKMKYQISEEFCIAIDTFKVNKYSYLDIKHNITDSQIDKIISEFKNV